MSASRYRTYRVSFIVREHFVIEVRARNEAEAERKASDLYETCGADHARGFGFDSSTGGTQDWLVEEVPG